MSTLIVAIFLLYALGSALLFLCIWSGSGDPLPPPQTNRETR
jgi:hypothetical protein